ncbi:TetR/AcrR family transcriptional regulator [Streptomyces spectabilis]|uniref:AcrR family transcriptional regulator n=1 Tax=Streptomyces spectabilis TaxID=68270 RepID=A0A5P2XDU0_STRST|nr:TetR/AcrR family transcriptional regulator [Streptomyces spectabilis]MBB5107137.1 AcrR family transcriptional regulator [Streptomyces spectabilis]MCI3906185.1 TetR/AcrR family transcriptional regulator [Streptomyces spectabilis]QEV63063.1 TetR/AcrR family transcriptional regulator [Streptomyces spectabilis]GGV04335.1 TetR family transcriptional regulator [Streptomyces spectabilis]
MTSREPVREHVCGKPSASRRSKLTPEREQEFYDAVLDQLRECGYEAVTMEGVAAATRCSKSTLYRQWKTKPQFVAAALRANRCVRFAGIDTGSVAGDLREAARSAAAWSERDTMLVQALSHAVQQDEDLQRALREALVEPEVQAIDAIVRRGVERGELPADHPSTEFVAAQLFGVLRVRPMLEGKNADAEYLTRFVDAVLLPGLGLVAPGPGPADGVAAGGAAD